MKVNGALGGFGGEIGGGVIDAKNLGSSFGQSIRAHNLISP
jgi:hypothetical protein